MILILDGPHGVTGFQVIEVGDIQIDNSETYCKGHDNYIKGEYRENKIKLL